MQIQLVGTQAEIVDFAETLKLGLAARNQIVSPLIQEALKQGQIIEAIKIRRAESGCGLKEAKDYVESLPLYPAARRVAGLP